MAKLQRLLLTATLPAIGCTEAAAAYRSHNHELNLGGDWYDLIDRPDSDSVVAIVGDVVGHGVEQIGVMGQLRAASHALCGPCADPHVILDELDRFARALPGAFMTTVAVLVLDGTTTARFCAAGHPPPIQVRSDGSFRTIDVGRRVPLGVNGAGSAETGTFDFDVEDLIVMYTDGVVERRTEVITEGMDALGGFVRDRFTDPCAEIATAIVDEFGANAEDDQAVMVLRPLHQRSSEYRRPHFVDALVLA